MKWTWASGDSITHTFTSNVSNNIPLKSDNWNFKLNLIRKVMISRIRCTKFNFVKWNLMKFTIHAMKLP